MSERKYVAISIKHTEYGWKFGMPCVLWGIRVTRDDEKRNFGGYSFYLDTAERYALGEFEQEGYPTNIVKPEPVKLCIGFCKKYRMYDTVLVEAEDYAAYCRAADIPTSSRRANT